MKKKFEEALRAATKDFGLSDKALKELLESGSKTIADDATEDAVKAQVDLFVNIARAMQGEVTRKVQAAIDTKKKEDEEPDSQDGKDSKGKSKQAEDALLEELKAMRKEMSELKKANKEAEAAKAEAERMRLVKEAADKIGIGEEFYSLIDKSALKTSEEAEALFTKAKQLLVNVKLPQKGAGGGSLASQASEAERAAAEAWAQGLPSKGK